MTDSKTYTPTTDEQIVSFGFGMQFGQQLLKNSFSGLDLEAVLGGITTVFNGQALPIEEAQMQQAYDTVNAARQREAEQQAQQMAQLSVDFMAQNGARDGVVSLASGVQYEVLEDADGGRAKESDTVRVHYEGSLIGGQVFDSSIARGTPAEFGVTQVIPGWVEVLQLMPVGAKWRVAIPADKAYGVAGSPPNIPGNSALVFEIHLIAVL